MKRLMAAVALLALLVAAAALAQQKGEDQPQQRARQMQQQSVQPEPARTVRADAALKELDGVMTHMRELSQWMTRNGTCHAYREMGEAMIQTGDRVQLMLRKMEQVCEDPDTTPTPEQLRELDRLQDKLRVMTRELKDAHDMLERIVGA